MIYISVHEDHIAGSEPNISSNKSTVKRRMSSHPVDEFHQFNKGPRKEKINRLMRSSNSPQSVFQKNRVSRSTSQIDFYRNSDDASSELHLNENESPTSQTNAIIKTKHRLSLSVLPSTLNDFHPDPSETSVKLVEVDLVYTFSSIYF